MDCQTRHPDAQPREFTIHNSQFTTLTVHPGALGDLILFGHFLRRIGGQKTVVAAGEKGEILAGLGAAEAMALAVQLEMAGLARRVVGGRYQRLT